MSTNKSEEQLLEEWNYEKASYQIPNVVLLAIYIVTGVIGNGVVIYGYVFKMKGKKEDRYFIPSLAMMDIVGCIIASSIGIYFELFPVMFGGTSALCQFLTFINMSATTASGLMLCVIAIQRYLKVCRPFSRQMTLFWKRVALMVTVSSGFTFSIPCFFFYGRIELHNTDRNITGYACAKYPPGQELGKWAIVYVCVTSISAILCTLSAMGLYGLILRTIYKSARMRESFKRPAQSSYKSNASSKSHSSSTKSRPKESTFSRNDSTKEKVSLMEENSAHDNVNKELTRKFSTVDSKTGSPSLTRKFTLRRQETTESTQSTASTVKSHFIKHRYSWMFMTITGIFIIAFAPWHAITVSETINPTFWLEQSESATVGLMFLYRLYILNHVANPFVYGLFDGAFRKVIRRHILSCSGEYRNKRVSVI